MGCFRSAVGMLAVVLFFLFPLSAKAELLRAKGNGREEVSKEAATAALCLSQGEAQEKGGDLRSALRRYRYLVRHHPREPEAPVALERMGEIHLQRHRFQPAFRCFQKILEKYPDYSQYGRVVGREFETAERLMAGQRNYFWGVVPGFKNREGAIDFFQKIVEQAPYGERAPQALLNIANLGIRLHEPLVAIDALGKIIGEYSQSPLAPDALLLLAKVHRDRVLGPDYDQRATREAANCYRQFLAFFPNSPRKAEAEAGLKDAEELLAANYLCMGDFYYNNRQNPTAAIPYYREALSLAAGSETGDLAHGRLEDISQGKQGRGSPIDFLFGKPKPL